MEYIRTMRKKYEIEDAFTHDQVAHDFEYGNFRFEDITQGVGVWVVAIYQKVEDSLVWLGRFGVEFPANRTEMPKSEFVDLCAKALETRLRVLQTAVTALTSYNDHEPRT